MNKNMKNKTIMYIVSYFPSTSQTFVLREINHLKSMGFQIKICAMRSSDNEIKQKGSETFMDSVHYIPDVAKNRIKLLSLVKTNAWVCITRPIRYSKALFRAMSGNSKLFLDLLRAGWVVQNLKLDKNIHLHAQFAHSPTNIAYFISLLNNNTLSFTSHAVDIFVKPQLIKEKLEKSKFAVTISNYNYDLLEKNYGTKSVENLHVIRCGIEKDLVTDNTATLIKEDRKPTTILTIGRMVEKKGFDVLIDSLKLLKEKGFDFQCRIVGDGGLQEELMKRSETNDLSNHVSFLGALSSNEIQKEFSSADLFVLPCKKSENGDMDGIPVVLMEAIANNVPVITTEISGIPELIINNQTGLLAKPNDAKSLYKQMSMLINDSSLKKKLTENAIRHLKDEFLLESNVERLADLMEKQLVH
ncbi:glycosyltransferase family 4 protein [Fictibacillus barbaricus]|uniref:Glycosyltransferase involved in cell wall biosynthesis n=1 Tax=Fictibacillus barbaricus TaxID=182136 RepID=A0ABU1U1C2_9BACL|nr:glycosyltransferase family 4 protein [Fictibacillus barbaricus]MDR7073186.1 glycosyltransferase involved in cell wall biosynthesis [Fictibacillus barbaricus]